MKKHFIIVLFFLSMIVSGCRPVVMSIIGDEEPVKEDIDTQIGEAVKQLVASMRPIYRDYEKYRAIYPITTTNEDGSKIVTNNNRTYRVSEENGEYRADYLFDGARPGDLGKIRLAILETDSSNDVFGDSGNTNSIIMEKVLALVYLQEVIANNFMVLELPAHGDWEEPNEDGQGEDNSEKEAEDSGWVDVTSEFRKDANLDEKGGMKLTAKTYYSKIARKLKNVDVILVSFLVEETEYQELYLRMIETRQGQIVAVGSCKIKRETPDVKFRVY